MQTIGLIGGITWQSTILYYQILNELAAKRLGGKHSAKCIIYSVQFEEVAKLQSEGRWDLLNDMMAETAKNLEAAGAEQLIICANTMHLCIGAIREAVGLPVIHIAEVTAREIKSKGLKKVALLGTKYTMEKEFFKDVLKNFGIAAIIPEEKDRAEIHRVIYDELSKGRILKSSKDFYIKIIENLIDQGAEGVILGCTEIPLLIQDDDISKPTFNTTLIHATAAFKEAIKGKTLT
ncbi:aspartate/glutamate racemase family protein [Sungkyunkwania multivorans]|uniref:Aspartate/glutamate racemase family protein n=1 Tax=Sungkyunkwania multivorans TaxID=1173618 RepID=A0ABW3CVJ6_9FLAO